MADQTNCHHLFISGDILSESGVSVNRRIASGNGRLSRPDSGSPVQITRSIELELSAIRNIDAYDAYFLICAQKLGSPLLTLDQGMRRIAIDLGIRTLEPKQ